PRASPSLITLQTRHLHSRSRSSSSPPSFFLSLLRRPLTPTLFPYTTLFRSQIEADAPLIGEPGFGAERVPGIEIHMGRSAPKPGDRKSTRLNSSHVAISYAVFCLKKKKIPGQWAYAPDDSLSAHARPHVAEQ